MVGEPFTRTEICDGYATLNPSYTFTLESHLIHNIKDVVSVEVVKSFLEISFDNEDACTRFFHPRDNFVQHKRHVYDVVSFNKRRPSLLVTSSTTPLSLSAKTCGDNLAQTCHKVDGPKVTDT